MTISPEEIDETATLLANVLSTRLINAVIVDTEDAGLRFKDLAKRMNVTPPGVTNILKSINLKLSTALKLSLAMGKELRLLYGDELIDTEFGPTTSEYLDAEKQLADRSNEPAELPEVPLEIVEEAGGETPKSDNDRVFTITFSMNGSAYERTYKNFFARTDGLADNSDEPESSKLDTDPESRPAAHTAPTSREFAWRHSEKVAL